MGGIYAIIHVPSGRQYIGSAKDFRHRRRGHFTALRRGDHHNQFLQRAWKKHGERQFEWNILLECADEDLFFYEQCLLDGLKPEFNVNPSASGTRGLKWTPESRARLSASQKERFSVPGAREAIRAALMANTTPEQRSANGKKGILGWTEESRARQIAKLRGRKLPEEVKRKISAAHTGSKRAAAARAAMSEAATRRFSDPLERKKLSKSRIGMEFSAEHKANMSKVRLGKPGHCRGIPKSAVTKARLSAALRGRRRSTEAVAKHRATMAQRRLNSVDTETR